MPTQTYEFSHQSLKQKIVLGFSKIFVLALLAQAIYFLGWVEQQSFGERLSSVGSIFVCFWAYANLLRVKTEIQELFVPPIEIGFAKEFMFIGFVLFVTSLFFW